MMTFCVKWDQLLLYVLILGSRSSVASVCTITHTTQGCLYDGGEFCYIPYKRLLDWRGAVDYCCKKGGVLARLLGTRSSEQTTRMYRNIFSILSMECGWVGMSDSKSEGHWQWTDGSDVVGAKWDLNYAFSGWFKYSYDCAVLCQKSLVYILAGGIWKLSHRRCSEKNYFICQFYRESNLPEGPESLTANVTRKDNLTRTETKKKLRKPRPASTHRRKPLVKRISEGTFSRGKILFDKPAFTVSMCARDCVNNAECKAVNYNRVKQRCVGISSHIGMDVKRDLNWELWQVYYAN